MSGVRFTNKLWAALFKLRHYPSSRPIEGVLMRRYDGGVGCGARRRGTTYPLLPSRAGLRPGTLGCPARSSLTAWTLRDVLAESADRTLDNAAMERREAPAFSQGNAARRKDWCATRCS